MEFSFDRPNRSDTQSTTNRTNSSSTSNASAASNPEEVDVSSIANERLRKAIERNRERQRAREGQGAQAGQNTQSTSSAQATQSSTNTNNIHQSAWAQHQAQTGVNNPREEMQDHVQSGLFENQNQAATEEIPRERPRPQARVNTRERFAKFAKNEESSAQEVNSENVVTTRRAPARPDDTEFTPVKRTSRKVAAQISYTTGSSKKRNKPIDPLLIDYFVKGTWLFFSFLVLRLIFAQGGVTAYYSQKSILKNRFDDLAKIKTENMNLVREIERMQFDTGYQKKLVRDNLGFIAQDEYLILFPKEKAD